MRSRRTLVRGAASTSVVHCCANLTLRNFQYAKASCRTVRAGDPRCRQELIGRGGCGPNRDATEAALERLVHVTARDAEYVVAVYQRAELLAIAQQIFVQPPGSHGNWGVVHEDERGTAVGKCVSQPLELGRAELATDAKVPAAEEPLALRGGSS